jgi:hypothetical protein
VFGTRIKETTLLQAVFADYADHTGRSLKSIHRVELNGRNIFLSQAKQMTMKEIGVKEGDVFHVPSVPTSHVLNPSEESTNKQHWQSPKMQLQSNNEHDVLSGLALPKTPAVRSTS